MIKIWIASFPNDCWGYFATKKEAQAWVSAFRKNQESLYGLPPSGDGVEVYLQEFHSMSDFLTEVNGSSSAWWEPDPEDVCINPD